MTEGVGRRDLPGSSLILIIDDDVDFAEATATVLRAWSYEVRISGNGEEGLALARELRPALVIADVLMPGRDGVDLCRALKQRPETHDMPVLLLSAIASERDMDLSAASGDPLWLPCDAYLAKPTSFADLQRVIERLIHRR